MDLEQQQQLMRLRICSEEVRWRSGIEADREDIKNTLGGQRHVSSMFPFKGKSNIVFPWQESPWGDEKVVCRGALCSGCNVAPASGLGVAWY